jgi:hypothetical protein
MFTSVRPSISSCPGPGTVTRTQGMPSNRWHTQRKVGPMGGWLSGFGTVSAWRAQG